MISARCDECGFVFPSVFNPGPDVVWAGVTIQGNMETCPRCGHLARTDDSFVNAVGGIVQAVRTMTWVQAQQARAIAHQVSVRAEPSEDLSKALAEISPELGVAIRQFGKGPLGKPVVLAIAALVLAKCSVSVKVDIDVADIIGRLQHDPPAASDTMHNTKDQKRGDQTNSASDASRKK